MGSYVSHLRVKLSEENHKVSSYDKSKLQRLLINSDKSTAVDDCLKLFARKCSTHHSQWRLLDEAITMLEERGKYRLIIAFAAKQIELSNEMMSHKHHHHHLRKDRKHNKHRHNHHHYRDVDDDTKRMMAKSFLSLSQANYNVSQFKKCIYYAEKSLSCIRDCNPNDDNKDINESLIGFSTLWRGKGSLGMSEFREALLHFEQCLSSSTRNGDWLLQVMTSLSLAELYLHLRDHEKALFFPLKALEIANEKLADTHVLTTCQLCLAEAYRKVGKNSEAMMICEGSMQVAIDSSDRRIQAYAMLCFADIHRMNREHQRAIPRYDLAGSLMIEIDDRYGQVLVHVGRAKTLAKMKSYDEALQQFACGLELALSIENKWMCVRVYGELAVLHQRLSNLDQAKAATLRYHQMLDDLGIFCAICRQPFGETSAQIETIMPCSHFVHFKCLSSQRSGRSSGGGSCQICSTPTLTISPRQQSSSIANS